MKFAERKWWEHVHLYGESHNNPKLSAGNAIGGEFLARRKYSEIEFNMIRDISENLKRLMSVRVISQKELCAKTGLSSSTISDYVNGKTLVSLTNLQKISDALNVKCRFVGFEWDDMDGK